MRTKLIVKLIIQLLDYLVVQNDCVIDSRFVKEAKKLLKKAFQKRSEDVGKSD